jgi:5-(carboxyamino)imidazole ribonucleotide mutase
VSIGGARNAGLLAVRILATSESLLANRMTAFQAALAETAHRTVAALTERIRKLPG